MITLLHRAFTNKTPLHLSEIKISAAKKDAIVIVVGVGITYLSALIFDFSEMFYAWSEKYEHLQFDEIPFALFSFAILSAWFSNRRLNESYQQFELRKEMEKALVKSQQLYKKLFDESLTGNCVMDADGNIEMYNANFLSICGNDYAVQNAQRLFDMPWGEISGRLIKEREVNISKIKINRRDKLVCYVAARLILISDASDLQNDSTKIHIYLADITEQCLAESDLENTLKENRQLAIHAMKVQENERKFIASEIHDETGQFLSAIRMDAATIRSATKSQAYEIAKRIESNAEHIQKSVKALIRHLRPPALDTNGLTGAIEQLVTEWGKTNPSIYYELSNNLNEEIIPEETNIVAYRLIQEALTNIHRHAEAKWVRVKLHVEAQDKGNCLSIEVRDDGKGIDFSIHHTGIGLIGMRERVESINGTFRILSRLSAGSFIHARLPLANF